MEAKARLAFLYPIIDDLNDDLSENEAEEEEEEEGEEEENEENEDGEDEEDDDDEDEMLPEQILAQSNVEEDLFSLMRTDEDDSLDDNEDLESIHLNNIDLEKNIIVIIASFIRK